jgi:DnaK suppressor protein
MDDQLIAQLRSKLEKRRAEITASYNRMRDASRDNDSNNGPLDEVDVAVSSYARDFLLSLSSIELKELLMIENSLAAMETDEYGLCKQCGTEISEKRLMAVPWARLCIKCQELEERGLVPSFRSEHGDDLRRIFTETDEEETF